MGKMKAIKGIIEKELYANEIKTDTETLVI